MLIDECAWVQGSWLLYCKCEAQVTPFTCLYTIFKGKKSLTISTNFQQYLCTPCQRRIENHKSPNYIYLECHIFGIVVGTNLYLAKLIFFSGTTFTPLHREKSLAIRLTGISKQTQSTPAIGKNGRIHPRPKP